jgi:excisionase family DNA binding protein
MAVGRLADVVRQALPDENGDVKLLFEVGGVGGAQVVPAGVVRLICDLLDDLAEGRAVTVAPYDLPVGTEAAAALLGVSRPWVTTLVDRGELPGERIGSKRRIRLGDLVAFRRADDARRRAEAGDWSFLDEPAD